MRETFFDFVSNERYKHISEPGDRLKRVKRLINWERFRSILSTLYRNHTNKGGRPNIDEITMIMVLILQKWYDLSDRIAYVKM